MEEIDQESMKHVCKFCNKRFPCGRSLGGHMRSHVIYSTDHHHHHHQKLSSFSNNGGLMNNNMTAINASSKLNDSCYELRKDPQKTLKSKDSNQVGNRSCSSVLDKLCKECGKGFQSWKALFGHMKCHSNKISNNKNSNTASLNQDSWTSQSDNENSDAKISRIKGSKSRNRRNKRYIVTSTTTAVTTDSSSISMNANNNQISSNNASTSVVSEIEQEQEADVAMSLMMLSRDVGKWGNEFDYCNSSVLVNLTRFEGKKLIGNGSEMKKLAETQLGFDFHGRSEVGCKGFEKTMIKGDQFDSDFGEFKDSSKRKFECATCNKSFRSYQALGGHKAGHKKLKGCFDSKIQNENKIESKPVLDHCQTINGYDKKTPDDHQESSGFILGVGCLKKTVVVGAHECPICLKMFSSGQALGGHKRSHLIPQSKPNQENHMNVIQKLDEPIRKTLGFIDLNMPPEEEMIMCSSTTEYKSYYWQDSSDHHNHESTLLGLLSTS